MYSTTTLIVLLAFSALALAGHSYQHGPSHGHEVVSYAQVTKYEDHGDHDAHEHHQDEHLGHDQVEHHGNNGHNDHHDDNHGHVQYEFKYGVKDLKTGDVKEQWESRDGHSVKGMCGEWQIQ